MNRKGNSAIAGTIVLILAIILGGLLGYVAHKYMSQGTVPQYHSEIAELIKIYDLTYNTTLTCVFIKASKTPQLSSLNEFTPKLVDYDVSEWGYYCGEDPNAYVNIWGPGNDGKTFYIEICKMSGNTLQVDCPDGTFLLETESYLDLLITVG